MKQFGLVVCCALCACQGEVVNGRDADVWQERGDAGDTGGTMDAGGARSEDAAADTGGDAGVGEGVGGGVDAADMGDATHDGQRTFCEGTPVGYECEPETNLDPITQPRGEVRYRILPGRGLSLPFNTGASTTATGFLQYTTNFSITGWVLHTWYSATPGGVPLEGEGCEAYREARGNSFWTQDASVVGDACFIGTRARTLYVNYEVVCNWTIRESCEETAPVRYDGEFGFDIAKQTVAE